MRGVLFHTKEKIQQLQKNEFFWTWLKQENDQVVKAFPPLVRWLGAFSNQGFGRMSFLVSLLSHFVNLRPSYTLLENNILENNLFACVIFIPLCLFTTWVNYTFL